MKSEKVVLYPPNPDLEDHIGEILGGRHGIFWVDVCKALSGREVKEESKLQFLFYSYNVARLQPDDYESLTLIDHIKKVIFNSVAAETAIAFSNAQLIDENLGLRQDLVYEVAKKILNDQLQ